MSESHGVEFCGYDFMQSRAGFVLAILGGAATEITNSYGDRREAFRFSLGKIEEWEKVDVWRRWYYWHEELMRVLRFSSSGHDKCGGYLLEGAIMESLPDWPENQEEYDDQRDDTKKWILEVAHYLSRGSWFLKGFPDVKYKYNALVPDAITKLSPDCGYDFL